MEQTAPPGRTPPNPTACLVHQLGGRGKGRAGQRMSWTRDRALGVLGGGGDKPCASPGGLLQRNVPLK